jgi:hypothetical protein
VGRHVGRPVGGDERDQPALCGAARVKAGRAEVRAAPDRNGPDAVAAGERGGEVDRSDADGRAEPVPRIEAGQRAIVDGARHRVGPAGEALVHAPQVDGHAPDAVGVRAPQAGVDEHLGDGRGVVLGQPGLREARPDQPAELGRGDEALPQGAAERSRGCRWAMLGSKRALEGT